MPAFSGSLAQAKMPLSWLPVKLLFKPGVSLLPDSGISCCSFTFSKEKSFNRQDMLGVRRTEVPQMPVHLSVNACKSCAPHYSRVGRPQSQMRQLETVSANTSELSPEADAET